ncbi:MAG: hypothetical protein ACR2NT_05045 [Acidimicrobiia bacterium]
MRRPTANKNGHGANLDALNPRNRLFYERTGHFGPYTNEEYLAVVGVLEPSEEDEPTPPPDVLKLMEAEDLTSIAFDVAHRAWETAIADVLRLGGEFRGVQSTGGERVLIDTSGREITGRDQRKIVRAQDAEQAAKLEREEAGVRLRNARVKSQEAQRGWRSTLYAAQLER